MKKNMGNIDRGIRILVAVLVGVLFLANVISGIPAYLLLGVSGVLLVTSLAGFCPLYSIFGFSTCPVEKSN